MTRAAWMIAVAAVYLVTVAFIWNFQPASAAKSGAQVDPTAITLNAKALKALPIAGGDMF